MVVQFVTLSIRRGCLPRCCRVNGVANARNLMEMSDSSSNHRDYREAVICGALAVANRAPMLENLQSTPGA